MKASTFATVLGASLALAGAAWARSDFLDIPVAEAKQSAKAGNLLGVPFYMQGEKHPRVEREVGEYSSNRRTNAFNKSDRDACHIAFLSAIIALQQRAQSEGGNAVVDIRSNTKNNELSSATDYRCAAGNVIANVALVGKVVKLAPETPEQPTKPGGKASKRK